jgi:hypothetical protein
MKKYLQKMKRCLRFVTDVWLEIWIPNLVVNHERVTPED